MTKILVFFAVLLMSNIGFAAQFSYTTLDVPGATETFAEGIYGNNIVGFYRDSLNNYHGFVYDGSTYTTLDVVRAEGIYGNNIVGNYDGNNGFLYNGSTYIQLANHIAFGISDNNIVGYYDSGTAHGFLYDGSTYTTLDVPGANYGTYAQGISGNNIVGYYQADAGIYGFLYNGTTYTTLDVPGANGTVARGIFGNYVVGGYHGGTYGFLYDGSTYTTLTVPGSSQTYATGIYGDRIVGVYYSEGRAHGFLAVPEPSTLALLLTATIGGLLWWRRRA